VKRSHRALTLAALLAAFALRVSAGLGCTVSGIDSPTDLVRHADAIYLVEARGYIQAPPLRRGDIADIEFSVLDTLKGSKQARLIVKGRVTDADDPNDRPVPYDFVRPGGRHGNCFAEEYRHGRQYLLFLKGSTPYWAALSPVNEQVSGEDDSWVRWVRDTLGRPREP
jgi:hypothetical protein